MAYLHATRDMGVKYGGVNARTAGLESTYSPLKEQLESLSDSDWSTGKSISGVLLILALGAIMWASKKQAVTSLSSAEAEYYAASACGAEILAMRRFLDSIGATCALPTPLHVDNSACVDISKGFNSCKRARHIDRRVNFLNVGWPKPVINQAISYVGLGLINFFSDAQLKPSSPLHRRVIAIMCLVGSCGSRLKHDQRAHEIEDQRLGLYNSGNDASYPQTPEDIL